MIAAATSSLSQNSSLSRNRSFCRSNDVLRGLLHDASQPLTSLHCALEISVLQGESSENILLALEQTKKLADGIRRMQEYLAAE
jgi:hypothetical protein